MKKLLIAAAGLTMAASALAPAFATPYDNPCSTKEPEKKSGTMNQYGDWPPSGNGATGVKGSDGYLEMRGSAAQANGGIHGATAGKELYGSLNNDDAPANKNGRACVGSGSTKVDQTF